MTKTDLIKTDFTILQRSKWMPEGEKCSKTFLSLVKVDKNKESSKN